MKKLDDKKAFDLIRRYIPIPKQYFVKTEKEFEKVIKKFSFPVVLKAIGKEIIHKTEMKAVSIVNNEEEAVKEFKRLKKIKCCKEVLVQEYLKGIETIVGIKFDETFGHLIVFGLGGIFVEVIKDYSVRVCPIDEKEAMEMIEELKAKKIFEGFRGIKMDKEKIAEILSKISKMAVNKGIKEMDINPLICNENGCYAVDVRIFV